jgi:hypothetical protein
LINDGEFHHISLVHNIDVGLLSLFIDFVEDTGNCTFSDGESGFPGMTNQIIENDDLFFIGMETDGNVNSDFLNDCIIDEFKISNEDNVVTAYFKFNAGTGDLIYDHSGNGNHATAYGSIDWVETEDYIFGCTNNDACNFNENATIDSGACTYADENYDCDGNCLSDQDNDLICDQNDTCPDDSENDIDNDGLCCSGSSSDDFALSFDGDSDYIEVPNANSLHIYNEATFSFDINVGDFDINNGVYAHILSKGATEGYLWSDYAIMINIKISNINIKTKSSFIIDM